MFTTSLLLIVLGAAGVTAASDLFDAIGGNIGAFPGGGTPTSSTASSPSVSMTTTASITSFPTPTPPNLPSLSNSQRLARGYPLLPPLRRRSSRIEDFDRRAYPSGLPKRASPSGIPVKRARPSNLPRALRPSMVPRQGRYPMHGWAAPPPKREEQTHPVRYSGRIRAIDASTGRPFAYVSKSFNSVGEFTYTKNSTEALFVNIVAESDGSGPFDVVATNAPSSSPAYLYLGAVIGPNSLGPDLDKGSSNHAFLVSSDATQPNAPPTSGGTSAYPGNAHESAIWSINPSSQTLYAHWVNTDGSRPAVTFLQIEDFFLLTGDKSAIDSEYGINSREVTLVLQS